MLTMSLSVLLGLEYTFTFYYSKFSISVLKAMLLCLSNPVSQLKEVEELQKIELFWSLSKWRSMTTIVNNSTGNGVQQLSSGPNKIYTGY